MSEIITDGGRRRYWGAAEELKIVEDPLDDRDSISIVARRNGVPPSLLYRWRRLMLEGESVAVAGDDDVTSNRQFREMEHRIRELERQLGRKILEVEILKEALDRSHPKRATLARTCWTSCRKPWKLASAACEPRRRSRCCPTTAPLTPLAKRASSPAARPQTLLYARPQPTI